mgnify:CR=1 FL=1
MKQLHNKNLRFEEITAKNEYYEIHLPYFSVIVYCMC